MNVSKGRGINALKKPKAKVEGKGCESGIQMRDKSRKKVATISTNSAITSSKMKKRPVQSSQSDQVISEKDVMFRKKSVCNPCNPLHYILGRQINDKVDHCKKLVDARFLNSQNLFRTDLFAHYGCVNAIEFSKQGNMLISG